MKPYHRAKRNKNSDKKDNFSFLFEKKVLTLHTENVLLSDGYHFLDNILPKPMAGLCYVLAYVSL